jgi:hypothetical protein
MVHLVKIADLLADALGLAVAAPINPQGFEEVLQELPEPARSRFHRDQGELRPRSIPKLYSGIRYTRYLHTGCEPVGLGGASISEMSAPRHTASRAHQSYMRERLREIA